MEMKWFVDLFLGLEKNEDLGRSHEDVAYVN